MSPLAMWLRRTRWVFVLVAGIYVAVFLRSMAWKWDLAWMHSILAGGTLLASPALSGAAVVVVHRLCPLEALEVGSVSPRAWTAPVHLTAAVWIHSVSAYIMAGGIASIVCLVYDADQKGVVWPWSVITGPAALLAAAALGVIAGLAVRGPWVVPVMVVTEYLAHRATYSTVLPELLTLKQATGSMANAGSRQLAVHLMASFLSNALAATALLAGGSYVAFPRGLRPRILLIVAGVCLVAIAVVLGWGWSDSSESIPL